MDLYFMEEDEVVGGAAETDDGFAGVVTGAIAGASSVVGSADAAVASTGLSDLSGADSLAMALLLLSSMRFKAFASRRIFCPRDSRCALTEGRWMAPTFSSKPSISSASRKRSWEAGLFSSLIVGLFLYF